MPAVLDPGLSGDLIVRLENLESALRSRYPNAMGFIRPGFDEEVPGLVRPWTLQTEIDEENEV